MNIFVLDKDPDKAARLQVNKSLVKMCLETGQLLSGAVRFYLPEAEDCTGLYKLTHVNHPVSKWVRETKGNFIWTVRHGIALCQEYTRRYGRTHKTEATIRIAGNLGLYANLSYVRTPFVLCMPDEFKTDCPVESYHTFYRSKPYVSADWNKNVN